MNSSTITFAISQSSSVKVYEERVPLAPALRTSSSWKRFIPKSTRELKTESTITTLPSMKTTNNELTVLRLVPSMPTLEELLNSPLFQVAGIFETNIPDWADKHDEYLAETYLENHAESK